MSLDMVHPAHGEGWCVPGVRRYVALGEPGPAVGRAPAFEIGSLDELAHCIASGCDPCDTWVGDTQMPARDVREAALRGVWRFAVDSHSRLNELSCAAPGSAVIVRVELGRAGDHGAASPAATPHEAYRILRAAPEFGLRPYGLCIDVAASTVGPYRHAIERAALVIRRLEQGGIRVAMMAIGGQPPPTIEVSAIRIALVDALRYLPYRPDMVAVSACLAIPTAGASGLRP